MHMTIREFQSLNSSRRLNETLLRWTLSNVLQALAFLHEEAEVVHTGQENLHVVSSSFFLADGNTDINPSNIMMTIADESLLERVETAEAENALPKKVVDNLRTIYTSHKLGLPKDGLWGQPALCDFGEARIGKSHKGLIQPDLYRAPEVLFGMEWGPSVDIWSVAAMVSVCVLKTLPLAPFFYYPLILNHLGVGSS